MIIRQLVESGRRRGVSGILGPTTRVVVHFKWSINVVVFKDNEGRMDEDWCHETCATWHVSLFVILSFVISLNITRKKPSFSSRSLATKVRVGQAIRVIRHCNLHVKHVVAAGH